MSVVEFALDPAAQHRVQLHIPTEQATITVMLNSSILGSLTPQEQGTGKDFRLPDNSPLHVRIFQGQPQVFRDGYPLPAIDPKAPVVDTSPAALAQEHNKKLGGCLIVWLVLNIVIIGGAALLSFVAALSSVTTGESPLTFLLTGLLGSIGVIGLSLIFFWKKLGFYIVAGYVFVNTLNLILFHLFNALALTPVVTTIILYVYLNRSGIWQKMS